MDVYEYIVPKITEFYKLNNKTGRRMDRRKKNEEEMMMKKPCIITSVEISRNKTKQ
jgi:hypothetical protein